MTFMLMLQTKNFYKVIDEYTLLIAPDTRQKRQEYEDQVIRTFFLSNADTKTVVTLLRSLLQSRQIAENGLTSKDVSVSAAVLKQIINEYTAEAGLWVAIGQVSLDKTANPLRVEPE